MKVTKFLSANTFFRGWEGLPPNVLLMADLACATLETPARFYVPDIPPKSTFKSLSLDHSQQVSGSSLKYRSHGSNCNAPFQLFGFLTFSKFSSCGIACALIICSTILDSRKQSSTKSVCLHLGLQDSF